MADESNPITDDFIARCTAVVLAEMADERFGVSELADRMYMSRSNLLRRIKQRTGQSASRFIREIRLNRAVEMLDTRGYTVSEVAHQVGFGSTSYFIKCFREQYGYPPGDIGKQSEDERLIPVRPVRDRWRPWLLAAVAVVVVMVVGVIIYFATNRPWESPKEKSIAVLPFKNDSSDSTNRYLINGLMEATLNNLQQIKDLRVVSRTSTEKYRRSTKTIPELADELQVSYVVEGSGQKVGDRILLNIQLIDARHDSHLWARQYEREVTDIFQLQQEIAKDIAKEIQAIVTWEEQKQIERIPTTDFVAYDLFLKAIERMNEGGTEKLRMAISELDSAISRDAEFALAYAVTAIAYHYLDLFQQRPQYVDTIGSYADKALLHDPTLAEGLFAKGVYYVNKKAYDAAIPYLEKALAYKPNSPLIIHFLADFYNWRVPNTAKYLEYALQGIRLDPAAHDSATASMNYLHLSNALIQLGFVEEALRYVNESIAYHADNTFAHWLRAVTVYARDHDVDEAEALLQTQLAKDSNQMHILQELGKLYFHTGNDDAAFRYYQRFFKLREANNLDLFQTADLDMAIIWSRRGDRQKSEACFARFKRFADADQSIYKEMHLALYAAYRGNEAAMIDHLRRFSQEDNFQYWILLFREDTMVAPYLSNPAFKAVFDAIENKFWNRNKQVRATLEEKGLL